MSADARAADRVGTRELLAARGVALARWYVVSTLGASIGALEALGGRGVLKAARRGAAAAEARRIRHPADLLRAWMTLGDQRFVLEEALDVAAELSVTLLRAPGGARVALPLVETHRTQVGDAPRRAWCTAPAPLPTDVAERAGVLALAAADAVGDATGAAEPLTVDLLLLADGRLVVSDVAAGGHATHAALEHACGAPLADMAARAARGLPAVPRAAAQATASLCVAGEPWCDDGAALRALADALARWTPAVTLRASALAVGRAPAVAAGTTPHDTTLTCCGPDLDAALAHLRRARAWCGLSHERLSAAPTRVRRRARALTIA